MYHVTEEVQHLLDLLVLALTLRLRITIVISLSRGGA